MSIDQMRAEFEQVMANDALLHWDSGMQEYRSVVTQKMWITWQAARAQGEPEPIYQWRVRNADHWNDCTQSEYVRLLKQSIIDCRVLYTGEPPCVSQPAPDDTQTGLSSAVGTQVPPEVSDE